MLKDVVVNLSSGGERDSAAEFAISIAQTFKAHLAGIAFAYEPVIPATIMGGIPTEIIESQRDESMKWAQGATGAFETAAKAAAISHESRIVDASLAGAADLFAQISRRFDISVVGQAERKSASPTDLIIEGALFESGRPVIVVPFIQKTGLKLDKVLIAWDGSRQAARAIADSMPFLERAGQIEILIVRGERGKAYQTRGAVMSQHLERHGLNVSVNQITSPTADPQSTILSHIADTGTDFLVMGGYGHSRLREFILGGVTRSMLASMTIPVLMSH